MADLQKRLLKEAFEMVRYLTSEEAVKQQGQGPMGRRRLCGYETVGGLACVPGPMPTYWQPT